MFHDLIRVLAWLTLILAAAALFVAPVLLHAALTGANENEGWTEERRLALALAVVLLVYCALFVVSAVGLLRRRRWGKITALISGALLIIQGVWHVVRGEWEPPLFCFGYAALAAWLLLHPVNAGYFKSAPAPSDVP